MATFDDIMGAGPERREESTEERLIGKEKGVDPALREESSDNESILTGSTGVNPVDKNNSTMPASGRKPGFYEEFYAKQSNIKERTPQEIAADLRKEKREKLFSAIGDGISALSNLYFTTKGANSTHATATSLSDKSNEKWDKYKRELEKDTENRLKYIEKDRGEEYKKRRDEIAERQYAEAVERQERHRAEEKERLERVFARDEQRRVEDREDKRRTYDAQIAADNAREAYYNAAANAKGKPGRKRVTYTFDGEEYDSVTEYNKAVIAGAMKYGIPVTRNADYKDKHGKVSIRTVNKSVQEIAAEVEAAAAKKTADEAVSKEAAQYKREGGNRGANNKGTMGKAPLN